MKNILLSIFGNYKIVINEIKNPKDQDIIDGIFDNLLMGEYVININNRSIVDINELETPLYTFTLEPNNNCELDYDLEL